MPNAARSFESIQVGEQVQFDVRIDEQMHATFASLSGDHSPIHMDADFSMQTEFGERIGYAFLLTSFLSRLYGEYLPGGSSVCLKQTAQFLKPYFVGDVLTVKAEVTKKIEATRFVEIESSIYRAGGECVFRGGGIVQVRFDKLAEQALFDDNGSKIFERDIVKALQNLGIKPGEKIFVHSDISPFGRLATSNRSVLLGGVVAALQKSVGQDGLLVMPTFTYSFCNGEIFDVDQSSSTVGVLTEFFRAQPDVIRSAHPIFSVAAWGRDKETFVNVGSDAFGIDSIFDKMHQARGKLVFLGAPFQSCTFLHYIEQMHRVPYRFLKTFHGRRKTNGVEEEDRCTYFVRPLDQNVILETARLEKHLLERGLIKEEKLGGARLLAITMDHLYQEGRALLGKDVNYFLKSPVV